MVMEREAPMPEREPSTSTIPRRVPLRHSIFVKLLAIMVALAACLLLMVALFFGHVVNPGVGEAIDRVLRAHAEVVAAQAPDLAAATVLARRIGLTIAYSGPKGTWSTDGSWPEGWDPTGDGRASFTPVWTRSRVVARSPDGGTYFFAWEFGSSIKAAHDRFGGLLLLLMAGVIFIAHEVLRRALRPIRLLYEGVGRLSAGDLDVEVPHRSRDELGALTEAFNQMARRVKEMIARRDQLLLDVSHELRSPLTRMKVALAMIPEGAKRERMEADVAEMEAMITGLLEQERLRDGRGVRLERQDLLPLVEEVAAGFRDTPPGVHVTTPAGIALELELDAERIRVLLRNLLDNALKYSLPDSRPLELEVAEAAGAVVVRVRDDGPGIPEADLESIFEPFFRSDRSRSKKTGGYGLGLSMCRRIVEAHGGTITAQNNPRRGATVVVTLPR